MGSNMSTKGSVTLKKFFIFNANYGPRKERHEEKKIIFFYPPDVDIDRQIKSVGLCQAIVKFAETFSDKPCQSVHTQKTRELFYEPEKDFWIIMTVTIPFKEKIRDGQPYIEYHEEDVQDSVYEAALRQAYRMFTLFNGTFEYILEKSAGDINSLKQRLDHFYARYLPTLRLHLTDILDVFNGIHFLPLDKNTYLRIQCFINLLESAFSSIKYTAFLYNDQLVWSGLEQEDMRMMYKYLTTSLFPSYMELELQAGHLSPSGGRQTTTQFNASNHYGKFITGPPNLNDETNPGKVPRVYINTEKKNEECFLLVYRAHNASICMLLKPNSPLSFDVYKKIDGFLGPQLSKLASDIGEQYAKRIQSSLTELSELCQTRYNRIKAKSRNYKINSISEPQYKYIYFNHMNLAQKTTVHSDNKKTSTINIPPETLKLLSDINSDITRSDEDGETIVKTLTDCWVVGKKSDQREFYVVINQKNANLIEINEEVKRLCSSHFNSIFFLE